jgi:hypothetical protein
VTEANVCVYVYGTVSAMKTTVLLSEDLYEILKRRYGPKRISEMYADVPRYGARLPTQK